MADELKAYEIRNVESLWEDKQVKGRGSFGAVYEVKANGVPCIAKRLHDILQGFGRYEAISIQDKTALRANFRRECVILSKLRHPNIVQFLGVYYGRREGDLALLMEYLHTDLDQCLSDNPDVPLPIKISILLDVSYGLLYLHTQTPEIIHRDLKAENVLLTTDMRAKLADLGVAKIINLRTCKQSHTIAPGTNAVMPPEALQPRPHYNYKLDVFSFGALTVHVVTQEFPNVHEVPFRDMKEGRVQIAKRMSVIQKMSQDHCLYPVAIECLLDDQNERPTTQSLNERLKKLSDQHPRQFHDVLQMYREFRKCTIQLQAVSSERDELKQNQERLNAHWESQVRRLEQQLQKSRLFQQFNVSQLQQEKQDMAVDYEQQLFEMKEQLQAVTSERDELKQNQERLNAHWESQVRRLEQQLQAVSSERDELKQNQERLNAHWESQVRRLEQQLQKSRLFQQFNVGQLQQAEPVGNSGEFNVGQLQQEKQDMAMDYERQLLEMEEQLQAVTSERGELKQNQERLNAQKTTENVSYYQRYQDSAAGEEPRSKLKQRDATSGVKDVGPVETVPTDVDPPVGGASATAQPPEDSIVQFMWVPLTEMSYPKITLLGSFKSGSVDLLLDGGGHYASKHVTIPRGVYEGQLVVGESFVHPVQKIEIENDGVVVLEFESSHHHDDSQYGYSSSQYGTGYVQSNPSYNINSGGGTSKYSNYSTGAYHDRPGGRKYLSTGSRHQYGGYQTTENVLYYQRYQDSAGYESRRSQVNDQQMHTSSTAQTPLMQAASIQEAYGDGYFRQLSKEEFSPEPVKSKLGASSTSVPDNTRSATHITGFDSSNISRVQTSHPINEDQTIFPTLEQYSLHKYTTGDDQYREDVVPKAERSRKTQNGDLWGGHWSNSSSSASLASTGGENRKQKSRSRSSGGYQLTNVRTKDGQVATYIQKPPIPLNPKEKPRVIVERGDGDFETGTLMYVGMINQKEMAGIELDIRIRRAGIQLDIRIRRPQNTGSSFAYINTDGTCELDGKRYFKCPSGYGVYAPISKVYVEADFDSVAV